VCPDGVNEEQFVHLGAEEVAAPTDGETLEEDFDDCGP